MDTESTVAIVCVVVALVLLILMTIFTMVKAWRQISRELSEKEKSQRSVPNTYDNMDCIQDEHAFNASVVIKDIECGGTDDRGQTADSRMSCTHGDHSLNKEVVVHEENNDTSF